MGKSTQKKRAKLEKSEKLVADRLTAHRESGKSSRGIITAHTEGIMTQVLQSLEPYYIRPVDNWTYTGKSSRVDKQRLSLLRHLCGIYPVPSFLENPMLSDNTDKFATPIVTTLSNAPWGNIISWYVAIAQGKSLYKTCTRGILTKRETHLLLQAPNELDAESTIWWAKSMAICDDVGIAYRIARSNFINRSNIKNDFWIDVHRFFTVNNVATKEIDELLDYVMAVRRENHQWTIKKRSLESVRRKSEEWHRSQYKMRHIGGGCWKGIDGVPTWKFKTGKFDRNPHKSTEIEWKVEQILTGNRLAREGQRMRHCVASYKGTCMEGRTAIFSMTSDSMLKTNQRNLTIEVQLHTRNIIQSRGYANRFPNTTEQNILTKWANDNRLRLRNRYH